MEEQQFGTPSKFVETIESISDTPLVKYLSFTDYMNHLFSKINCGVPYVARSTRMNFKNKTTWRFECCFGGRSRNNSYKTKKNIGCSSYIEFSVYNSNQHYYISFSNANWVHNHPLDQSFLESFGILTDERVDQIKDMASKGKNAREIRNKPGMGSIPAKHFYEFRRKIIKQKQTKEIGNFLKKCDEFSNLFFIYNHWKKDLLTNIQKFNGSSFISKRFINLPIAADIVFLDDTTCVDEYDFPLITLCFEDQNKYREILAFGFMAGREFDHFKNFLEDIKKN